MKLDNYYYLEYLDYWPHPYYYNDNVSANMSFGFFRCFLSNSGVHRKSRTEPFIWTTVVDCSNSVNYSRVKMLVSIPCYSYLLLRLNLQPPNDFTQKQVQTKRLIHCAMCPCQSEFLGLINLKSSSLFFNRIETVYPCGPNKEFTLRFCVNSRIQHETSEEDRKTYRPKPCDYNNKGKVNSPNILSNDFYTEFNWFRYRVFLLLDWLPYQG